MFKIALSLVVMFSCLTQVSAVEAPASELSASSVYPTPSAKLRLSRWHNLIATKDSFRSEKELVVAVDEYINRVDYQPDGPVSADVDDWAPPWEFVAAGQGDCEDFAIAKFFTLQAMGVPIQRLRLVYVILDDWRNRHMVLAYYPDDRSEPWVLDNLTSYITFAGQRPDLQPVFSFTPQNVWLMNGWLPTITSPKSLNLPKWNRITRSWQEKLNELSRS
ncbi:transglutaminase-like cysteine peptidase [Amphritea sp. HPY]|uniref:transglutaminase-like cysteine peptidase n=1 Tax=Amphritea sp. HPY TaxID=3421652 RepID=UPI003D7E876C